MKSFKRILCDAGFGESRKRVLERAVDIAIKNQAELTVVDIIEPWANATGEHESLRQQQSIKQARIRQLEHSLKPFRAHLAIELRSLNVQTLPFLVLVHEVLEGGYDLLIRESEDPDWIDRVLGSDDLQLLRTCPCPVLLLDPSASSEYRRIMVAVDVDRQYPRHELETRHALNCLAMQLACSQAIAESAELHVVHAWSGLLPSSSYDGLPAELAADYIERTRAEHDQELARLVRETADVMGSEAMSLIDRQDHLLEGPPRRVIPELANRIDVDLMVMGSVARTGIRGLLVGNTAESILAQLDCSVLVVKPPGFVSPVSLEA